MSRTAVFTFGAFGRPRVRFWGLRSKAGGGTGWPRRNVPSRPHLDRRTGMNELDQPGQVGRVGVREDAVSQVEDMAVPPADEVENPVRGCCDPVEGAEE